MPSRRPVVGSSNSILSAVSATETISSWARILALRVSLNCAVAAVDCFRTTILVQVNVDGGGGGRVQVNVDGGGHVCYKKKGKNATG
jgi:hypothetical protein